MDYGVKALLTVTPYSKKHSRYSVMVRTGNFIQLNKYDCTNVLHADHELADEAA